MDIDTVYQRPLTPTDRFFLALQPLFPPAAIQVVIEGHGELDPAAFEAAVAAASQHNPGAQLVRRGRFWRDSGRAPHVERIEAATIDFAGGDPDHRILRRPFVTPDATVDILLLPGDPAQIVVRAFHGVMDGTGLAMWMLDVFRGLCGEEPIGALDTTTYMTLHEQLAVPGPRTAVSMRYPSPIGHGPIRRGEPRALMRYRSVVTPRRSGAATTARIAVALTDLAGRPSRYAVPVDLRQLDPAIRSSANLSPPLLVDVVPGDSVEQVRDRIRQGIDARIMVRDADTGGASMLPAPLQRTIMRAGNMLGSRYGRNAVSAVISHGMMVPAMFDFPGFQAKTVRPIMFEAPLAPVSFVLAGTDDTLEMSVSARAGRGVAPRLDAMLDTLVSELSSG